METDLANLNRKNGFHEEALRYFLKAAEPGGDDTDTGTGKVPAHGIGISIAQLRLSMDILHSPVGSQGTEYKKQMPRTHEVQLEVWQRLN